MKWFCLILFTLIPSYLFSQNMLINGGFENFIVSANQCPTYINQLAGSWTIISSNENASYNSRDFRQGQNIVNPCFSTWSGFKASHSQHCLWYQIFGIPPQLPSRGINLFEVKLCEPLIKNQKYYIEVELKASTSIWQVQNYLSHDFQIYITDKSLDDYEIKIDITNKKPERKINYKPQITFFDTIPVSELLEWKKFSAIYEAKGNEQFMVIGNHSDRNEGLKKDTAEIYLINFFVDNIMIIPYNELIINIKDIKQGATIQLKNIFFDSNQYTLLPESYPELNNLVEFLSKNNKIKIQISGHTDNKGNEKTNQKLSEERAKAVTDYLLSKKIENNRIKYKGFGSKKPIANNNTEIGRAQNRRVELVILEVN